MQRKEKKSVIILNKKNGGARRNKERDSRGVDRDYGRPVISSGRLSMQLIEDMSRTIGAVIHRGSELTAMGNFFQLVFQLSDFLLHSTFFARLTLRNQSIGLAEEMNSIGIALLISVNLLSWGGFLEHRC